MDKPTLNKKNLRAHRRTVSSNLEDLNFRQEPPTIITPPIVKLPTLIPIFSPKQKEISSYLANQTQYLKIPFTKQQQHEVAKLVRASSEQTLQKKVIVDSLHETGEYQQKSNKEYLNYSTLQEIRTPLHSPKLVIGKELEQHTVYLGVDGRSFKKKQRPHKSIQVNKETKRKLVGFKKLVMDKRMESQYFIMGEKGRKEGKNQLRFKFGN